MSSNIEIKQESDSSLKIDLTPCVRLKSPDGSVRLIKSGQPYRKLPGEVIDGVDRTCGSAIVHPDLAARRTEAQELKNELDQAIGTGAGDWIKTLAKPFALLAGKTNCTACEARRLATNAYAQLKGKHGQLEAMRIMKELWSLSFTSEPVEVLRKLETYLK